MPENFSADESSKLPMYTDNDRVMALAGVYQAAQLTQQIARRGLADTQAMSASIGSLFKVDSTDVSDVYGGMAGIQSGLRLLQDERSELRVALELAGQAMVGLLARQHHGDSRVIRSHLIDLAGRGIGRQHGHAAPVADPAGRHRRGEHLR